MFVCKRGTLSLSFILSIQFILSADGRREEVHFDKITSRIRKLCYGLNEVHVDPVRLIYFWMLCLYLYILLAHTSTCVYEQLFSEFRNYPYIMLLTRFIGTF
jgi:hypothetical protein